MLSAPNLNIRMVQSDIRINFITICILAISGALDGKILMLLFFFAGYISSVKNMEVIHV